MNINPKKNWHVRSKTNIARVKADEAAAAERDRIEQERVRNAEQEARIRLLRDKSRQRVGGAQIIPAHDAEPLNLFFGGEDGKNQSATNAEHEAEKKAEKEKEEKAIGLLTYLGQSVIDAQHAKPWWSQPSKSAAKRSADPEANKIMEEWETKKKQRLDPLSVMSKATTVIEQHSEKKRKEKLAPLSRDQQLVLDRLPLTLPDDIAGPRKAVRPPSPSSSSSSSGDSRRRKKKKKKKEKKKRRKKAKKSRQSEEKPNGSSSALEALRAERLKRERAERSREVAVIHRFCLQQMGEAPELAKEPSVDERKMPYNSAFNPEISRQMNPRRKRTTEQLVADLIRECRP